MSRYNGTLNVAKVDLVVSEVKQIATDKIRVTFNKELKDGEKLNKSEVTVYKTNDKAKTQLVSDSGDISLNSDKKSFDITLNKDSVFSGTASSQAVNVNVNANSCTDKTHLSNKVFSRSITLTKDNKKPTVSSVKLNSSNNGIVVTLSEEIGHITAGKISIRKNGVELRDGITTVTKNSANVIEVVTSDANAIENSKFKPGNYSVYIESGAFADLSGNTVDAVNTSEIVVSSTPTVQTPMNLLITQNITNDPNTHNTFEVTTTGSTVTADKTITYSSELYKNFSIDGKVIPSNSNVRFKDHCNQTIIVTLPSDYIKSSGTAELTVSGLKVSSGRNVNSKVQTINVIDNIAPTLNSVELTTVNSATKPYPVKRYEMKLTFSEKIEMNTVDTDVNKKSTLSELLKYVEIKTGDKLLASNNPDLFTYKVSGNQVIITLQQSDIKDGSTWASAVANKSTTVFKVKNDIDIITDTDTTSGRSKMKVRKGTELNIVKRTISE